MTTRKLFSVLTICLAISSSATITDIEPNDTPIIGILSQETSAVAQYFPNETYDSFIAASYVKFLESAGARVLPIWINQTEEYYRRVVEYTNGILFPGGATDFKEKGGYGEAATHLYNLALESNDNGTYYPIWGTCQGMQVLSFVALNGTKNILVGCTMENIAVPLEFAQGYRRSKLFAHSSIDIINILNNDNVTYNSHKYCLTKEVLKDNGLVKEWDVISINKDVNNLEFISAMEHKIYPIYGVQFHPEKSQFEFKRGKGFPHSFNSIKIAQYFANFLVNECKKNNNKFSDETVEADSLIYNFSPKYTGLNGGYNEQIYVFLKDDFKRTQLV